MGNKGRLEKFYLSFFFLMKCEEFQYFVNNYIFYLIFNKVNNDIEGLC